jgi:hypothetical protein
MAFGDQLVEPDIQYTEAYQTQREAMYETPIPLAPSGLPIADIAIDPAAGTLDQAALEQAVDEGKIVIQKWWETTAFMTGLLFLAGGYGAAWLARRQRWV